jgi:hypothetical protein
VNVSYALDAQTAQTTIGKTTVDQCSNVDQGWYYDDETTPKQVLVCPQTCRLVQGSPDAGNAGSLVSVSFGCKTHIAIAR